MKPEELVSEERLNEIWRARFKKHPDGFLDVRRHEFLTGARAALEELGVARVAEDDGIWAVSVQASDYNEGAVLVRAPRP